MLSDELRNALSAAATEAGFTGSLDLLTSEARECVYFTNATTRIPGDDKPGASRIGGVPDLPDGAAWPEGIDAQDRPCGHATFIAQFNLADIPPVDSLPLPRRGGLWLFARRWAFGHVPMIAIHHPDPQFNDRPPMPTSGEWPVGGPFPLKPTPIRFERGVSLPFHRQSFRDALGPGDNDGYFDELLEAIVRDEFCGQVGGYSVASDQDPYRTLAFRRLGRIDHLEADGYETMAQYEKDVETFTPPMTDPSQPAPPPSRVARLRPKVEWIDRHRDEIAREAAAWQLLFSFRRNLKADLDLGSATSLDVFIRSPDLNTLNFDHLIGELPQVL
ncbi:MAG: hypothetical protein JWN51_876 [Phycisphaerales bacterium]|nr:hypothetical protein [Phycisphaerales bacterium]